MATVRMPSSCAERKTRMAISLRLAAMSLWIGRWDIATSPRGKGGGRTTGTRAPFGIFRPRSYDKEGWGPVVRKEASVEALLPRRRRRGGPLGRRGRPGLFLAVRPRRPGPAAAGHRRDPGGPARLQGRRPRQGGPRPGRGRRLPRATAGGLRG